MRGAARHFVRSKTECKEHQQFRCGLDDRGVSSEIQTVRQHSVTKPIKTLVHFDVFAGRLKGRIFSCVLYEAP